MARKRKQNPTEHERLREQVAREPQLLVHAAYWLAGRAVAERHFGRSLLRVPCPIDADEESLRQVLLAFPPSRQLQVVGGRIFPWLQEVGRLEQVRRLTAEEAQAYRKDLWAPLLLWMRPEEPERPRPDLDPPARVEIGYRQDAAVCLAGGEAVRRVTREVSNPCLEEASGICASLPDRARERALSWAASRAETLVREHWGTVERLAGALLANDDIDGPLVEMILDQAMRHASPPPEAATSGTGGASSLGRDLDAEPSFLRAILETLREQASRSQEMLELQRRQVECLEEAALELRNGLAALRDALSPPSARRGKERDAKDG